MYDDFIEVQSGALKELRVRLESESTLTRCDNGDDSSTSGRLVGFRGFFSRTGQSSPSSQRNNRTTPNSGCLPTHNPQSGSAVSATNPSTPTTELLYLLLCINSSNFGANLYHEHIQHITCDRALFHHLCKVYAQRRSKLRLAISLRTVRSINIIKVSNSLVKLLSAA